MDATTLTTKVRTILEQTPTADIHTHVFSEVFGDLLLWGIDEQLTYHYLVAELFRVRPDLDYGEFWAMPKAQQAELVWDEVFIRNSPVSEAARGVVTTLHKLGIDPSDKKLDRVRDYFANFKTGEYIGKVFEVANVKWVIMTNDPFDKQEHPIWNTSGPQDGRFRAALRLDGLLNNFPGCAAAMGEQGFSVNTTVDAKTVATVRDFLRSWIEKMKPVYMAVSLPPTFSVTDGSPRAQLINECILPVAREHDLPFAMMIGVKKLTNPALQDAGDSVGKADISVVEGLCRDHPDIRFVVTMLSRENQHELCVAARKFKNLLVFGCWWFLNNPSIVREMTAERLEMLGLTMIPQHSDARVLDQLIYKWSHSRDIIAEVLAERYAKLQEVGWPISDDDIRRDVERVVGGGLLVR